jgi:hypothetical protein
MALGGSSAAAQSFHQPRTHTKDPARCPARRIKTIHRNAPKSGCALVRRSGRNIGPIAVEQRKQFTVKEMEGVWIRSRVGQGCRPIAIAGIAPVKVNDPINHLRRTQMATVFLHRDACLLRLKTPMVLVCRQPLASHLSHLTVWEAEVCLWLCKRSLGS